jgi:hypothetical protein
MLEEEIPARYVLVPCGRRPALAALCWSFSRSESVRHVATVRDGDQLYEVVR